VQLNDNINLRSGNYMAIAIDPICKMKVEESTCKITSEYKGKKYYFCAPGCKKAFDKDPEKYLTNTAKT
jgi:YHS domain-containing protein